MKAKKKGKEEGEDGGEKEVNKNPDNVRVFLFCQQLYQDCASKNPYTFRGIFDILKKMNDDDEERPSLIMHDVTNQLQAKGLTLSNRDQVIGIHQTISKFSHFLYYSYTQNRLYLLKCTILPKGTDLDSFTQAER